MDRKSRNSTRPSSESVVIGGRMMKAVHNAPTAAFRFDARRMRARTTKNERPHAMILPMLPNLPSPTLKMAH